MAKSIAQKKRDKAAYDREYRKRNRALLKAKKAAYFQRTYDPAEAAKERKKKMPQHIEYCRQKWYRQYKRDYDRNRRSSRYGEYAECHSLLVELQKEIRKQMPSRFDRYRQTGRKAWSPLTYLKRRIQRGISNPFSLEP